jgi:membrane protein required for colicin V production
MSFNWLDAAIVLILFVSIITSVQKGFSREVIGLVAAFVGLILGIWFYGTAGAWLQPYVSSSSIANFLGFLIVFVSVIIVGGLLSWVVSRMLRTVGLSWIDRMLGAAFGIARGLLMSVALVMIMVAFAPGSTAATPPSAVVSSRLAPYVIGVSRVITQFAPYELKDEFHKRYDQVKRAWDDRHAQLLPK